MRHHGGYDIFIQSKGTLSDRSTLNCESRASDPYNSDVQNNIRRRKVIKACHTSLLADARLNTKATAKPGEVLAVFELL